MSADLVITATRTPEALAAWRRIERATWIGDDDEDYERDAEGYLVDPRMVEAGLKNERGLEWKEWEQLREQFDHLPHVWIGQVSWLKGGLFEEWDRYVPGPVEQVSRLIGDQGIVLTPGVAGAIMAAMNLPNRSIYGKPMIRYVKQEEYDEAVATYRKKRERRWHSAVPIGNRRLLYPGRNGHTYSGMARRQYVKRWLAANMGATLIQESQ
jgi:hypothetical protein